MAVEEERELSSSTEEEEEREGGEEESDEGSDDRGVRTETEMEPSLRTCWTDLDDSSEVCTCAVPVCHSVMPTVACFQAQWHLIWLHSTQPATTTDTKGAFATRHTNLPSKQTL